MKTADKIRRIYERRPYPFGDYKALKRASWNFSLEWIEAMGRSDLRGTSPLRVLVAGCGDGSEAFNLKRQLPKAEIVAVDFSPRSVAIAKRLQKRDKSVRDIRFVAADLTDPRLPAMLGGAFDLIVCHGVLSYVTRTQPALANFARCLKPSGVLYLGVNGSNHVSVRLRHALPALGYDMNSFRDRPQLRGVLRLCDSITKIDGYPGVSGKPPGFLAGDVFGALNKCLPLQQWVSRAGRAGLHFRGSWIFIHLFRKIAESGHQDLLIPMSRAQAGDFMERLHPSQFHRLLFSRTPESNPPWESRRRLLKWRIAPTSLYELKLPVPRGTVRDRLRRVRIASPAYNLSMEWQMPEWQCELLRRAGDTESLAHFLRVIPLSVPFPELRSQLYLLYQMGAINLAPPAAA